MARRRFLVLLKPLDVICPSQHSNGSLSSRLKNPKILKHLDNRLQAHRDAIGFCQSVLKKKSIDCISISRHELSKPVHDVDLVVTVGGDGTLLQASHFMDDTIPVLGVNSDPTQPREVEESNEDFDATRSTGYLCAATADNFEQVLDDILENRTKPAEVSRMLVSLNSQHLPTYALNDILVAHPSPATVSRLSFRIEKDGEPSSPLVNCRSSGLRVSTSAGSTAAMLSAGGCAMPILSKELQYIVREPISHGPNKGLTHGFVKHGESMEVQWHCKDGMVAVDGSHVVYHLRQGDILSLSSAAPVLKLFLPSHLLS
ncbi:unnamed protein product [Cuscuta campestris]|uniref:NADH kinase n=1 Tax=Cuscuta campestris TaxID=132261 RepID=A0A484M6J6_9ASTE|nr:unnamed protein product [Cuscuta campestris]